MEFSQYQEIVKSFSNDDSNKRNKFLNSGLEIIKYTGNLSGNIKSIAYDINSNKETISELSKNMGQIIRNLAIISSVVNISLEDLVKETIEKGE